jgi:hypothetical protein
MDHRSIKAAAHRSGHRGDVRMTGYRHFRMSGSVPAKANVANDRSAEDQTLATTATLALAAAQTTKTGGQTELEPKSDSAELQERIGMASGRLPELPRRLGDVPVAMPGGNG